MKLYSWNVNGIRAVWNKGKFQEFIQEHQPDILCLQETKAQPDQSPVDLPDYVETWCSAGRKGYSGTAIFSRDEPLSVIRNFPDKIASKYQLEDRFGNTNDEGRVLACEFSDFWVVSVYTPNSKGDLGRLQMREQSWDPAFADFLTDLSKTKPVLAAGDFNVAHQEIDLARPKPNVGKHGFTNEERQGFTNLLERGFLDSFRLLHPNTPEAYTWWTQWGNSRANNVGWRIDYWVVDRQLESSIINAAIHPDIEGSDHCPTSLELSL